MNHMIDLKLKKDDSFEAALFKLEEIVSSLEKGNLNLDETLSYYEEGIRLYRYCNEKLDKAEQKITLVVEEAEIPFNMDRDMDHSKED